MYIWVWPWARFQGFAGLCHKMSQAGGQWLNPIRMLLSNAVSFKHSNRAVVINRYPNPYSPVPAVRTLINQFNIVYFTKLLFLVLHVTVYGPNTESFGCRKAPKGFRPDRDQRAPVPIGRMKPRVSGKPKMFDRNSSYIHTEIPSAYTVCTGYARYTVLVLMILA